MSDEGMSDARVDELGEIARRDDWHRLLVGSDIRLLVSALRQSRARLDKAERERDALREALRPFAMVAEHDIGDSEHDNDLYVGNGGKYNRAPSLYVRHFRAALTANHSAPQDQQP